ncbi:T9SS type A sorting domain-containing protein [bacterium]|nr:T9SS type A sorting domain-containing protein [bacterium]
MNRRSHIFLLVALIIVLPLSPLPHAHPFQDDIFYQIFPISFRDSDGNGFGDFDGIVEAIPYLQDLSITAVWLNPVFYSKTYHGYQYVRHDSLNPRFGSEAEFIAMVETLHDAGIDIYIDLVAYGVSEDHPFFQDAWGNPSSAYDQWFAFTDDGNWNYFGFGGGYHDWQGNWITHVFWDHNHQPVRDHLVDKLSYWLDPNDDGDFHDGIDGFRIDHLSVDWWSESQWGYDLSLWDDLTAGLREVNPNVRFIAEDSHWGAHHPEIFDHGLDAAFNMPFLASWDRYLPSLLWYAEGWELSREVEKDLLLLPDSGQWLGLLNNHDVNRISENLMDSESLCKLAAVWLFTSPFPPCLYYGEEIGMRGHKVDWYGNDANDLHIREPLEWNAVLTVPPHAQWYQGHSQYSSNQFAQDNDGVSIEEQDSDSTSLLNHYRSLAALRTEHAALHTGEFDPVWVGDERVYACLRHDDTSSVLVAANLADGPVNLEVDFAGTPLGLLERTVTDIWQGRSYDDITIGNGDEYPLHLDAQSAVILGIGGAIDTSEHRLIFQVDLSAWDPDPDLFPPELRGDKYPLSWYYGQSMDEVTDGIWQTEVECKGSLHGQTVEYKYKLSGRGFADHSIGWSPDPNLSFVVDTTQHPQTLTYNGTGWTQPYREHPLRFVIDLSHWEQQPFQHDLEVRGDFEPLSWYDGIDTEYAGEGIWSQTVIMTLAQNTWFYYKFKLNGPQFSSQGEGWTPGGNRYVSADLSGDTLVVVYDGDTWYQPYETSVDADNESPLPQKFRLYQNYPNPFNAATTIRYDLPEKSRVQVHIFNVRGQLVERLVDERQGPGHHDIVWDAKNLSSGIYFYQIIAGENRATGKCLLVR